MTDGPIAGRLLDRTHQACQPTRHRRREPTAHTVTAASMSVQPDWPGTSTRSRLSGQTVRMVIEIDPRTVDILDQATRERYRIMACAVCGGPEVHAKNKPAAKCFRCGQFRTQERITPLVTRQRCRRCQETFWEVLKTTTCVKCRGKWTQEPKTSLQPVRVV